MTHGQLVEEVAQAMYPAMWPRMGAVEQMAARSMASRATAAVAEALKEPTSTMIKTGVDCRLLTSISGENDLDEDIVALWQTMLSASPLQPGDMT